MRIAQEVDSVNGRVIIAIAAATVAITALGVFVAWLLAPPRVGPAPAAEHQGQRWGRPPDEVNALEMAQFPRRMPRALPPAPRLHEYGWVDREAGTVHIPLERAKELYLARHHRAGSEGASSNGASP